MILRVLIFLSLLVSSSYSHRLRRRLYAKIDINKVITTSRILGPAVRQGLYKSPSLNEPTEAFPRIDTQPNRNIVCWRALIYLLEVVFVLSSPNIDTRTDSLGGGCSQTGS
jgi:hypothetical protein